MKLQRLKARGYASQAASQPATADVPYTDPMSSMRQQSTILTPLYTEASTSQEPFRAQADQLRELLIDATGRNPDKQRQIAWAAQEGGAEEEEEWLKRLEWAASHASGSRSTVVTGTTYF